MSNHTIDLLDQSTILLLNAGLYAKLSELRAEQCETQVDRLRNQAYQTEQYLTLAKLEVHFEQAAFKAYGHTPLEAKLAKAKIATAKAQVEVKQELLDIQRELLHDTIREEQGAA